MKTNNIIVISIAWTAVIILMAHTVWIESTYKGSPGDTVVFDLYFGEFENDLRAEGESVNSMKDFTASYIHDDSKPVSIELKKTLKSMQGSFTASKPGFYQILAVNDTRAVQDLTQHGLTIVRPIEFQRSSFTALSARKTGKVVFKPNFYLDIIPNYPSDNKGKFTSVFQRGQAIKAKLYRDNKPYPEADISILGPKKKTLKIKSTSDGTFSFSPEEKGTFIISAFHNDSTSGTFQGKNYKMIRYHSSTTLYVE